MLTIELKKRHPSQRIRQGLNKLGIAVEHFPRYVNKVLRPHALDVVLLSVILRGRGKHVIESEIFEESGASVGITHYGQRHDILTDDAGMDMYNVYLDLRDHPPPPLPAQFNELLPVLLPMHPRFANRINRCVRVALEDPQPVEQLLRRMECEQRRRLPGADEAMRSCLVLLLTDVCRAALAGHVKLGSLSGRSSGWVEDIRSELEIRYTEDFSLDTLSRRHRVSKGHLCRAFKRYTGRSIMHYLVERRIQAAMFRLRSGQEKIIGIATTCGFRDLAYFNRAFKQLVGQTPGEYRRQLARRESP